MESELEAWLRLAHAPGVGPVTRRTLCERWGGAGAVVRAGAGPLRALGLSAAAVECLSGATAPPAVQRDLQWAALAGNAVLGYAGAGYSPLLREIQDAPAVLYLRGDPEVLTLPALAVVGSRHPTASGAEIAFEFGRHLAAAGLVIVSGLAYGVDAAAHRGALAAGGITLAVLGTGPDQVYPARHGELAERILQAGGALVTELPPGTPVRAANFPRRNRLISGLALGTLVVEAALRSGSLITARHASEQGREVFAIPGSIHNPLARGCHALIRQGAKLVETGADVLEELAPQLLASLPPSAAASPAAAPPARPADPDHARLLACLDEQPAAIDQLVARSGFAPQEVASMLLILELQGFARALPGGFYGLARPAGTEGSVAD